MGHERVRGGLALRITTIYMTTATAWIVGSDVLLASEGGPNLFTFSLLSIGKGLLFVAVTASVLFLLLWRAESQLYLRSSALEAAANAIAISDVSGTIEWVNPAFTALTGYPPRRGGRLEHPPAALGRPRRRLLRAALGDDPLRPGLARHSGEPAQGRDPLRRGADDHPGV